MSDRKSRRTILKVVASLPAAALGFTPGCEARSSDAKPNKRPAAIFHLEDFSEDWSHLPFVVKADETCEATAARDVRGFVMRLPGGDFVAYDRQSTELGCKFEFVKDPVICQGRFQYLPQGPVLACKCHNSVFDLSNSGKAVSGPEREPLTRIPLKLCHDKVCVLPFDG